MNGSSAPGRAPVAYGPFARWLLGLVFGEVAFPPDAAESLRALAARATPIYVLRSSSLQHLLYFNFTFWKLGLPIARAATGLGSQVFGWVARWFMGGRQIRATRQATAARTGEPGAGESSDRSIAAVVEAARQGESALVFLRLPRTFSSTTTSLADPFPALVALQRSLSKAQQGGDAHPGPRPIVLVPLTFLWSRRPKQLSRSWRDVLFGDPEEPGAIRAFIGFLLHRSTSVVRIGTPIDLAEALDVERAADLAKEKEGEVARGGEGAAGTSARVNTPAESAWGGPRPLDDARIARRIRGFLHQHLLRESRVVTGPPLKRPDRVRDLTLRDLGLRRALAEIARERGRADDSVEREAVACLDEIAARYTRSAVDVLKWFLGIILTRIYDGVDLDLRGLELLKEAGRSGPLIVCPCHKSHIDYLILSYIFDEHNIQPPHIAAGENLNFFPVGRLLRMGGAFFIRRSFKGDKVYGATLSAYVKQLLRDGFTQEFFLEGGRSRTGKLLPPKFGMLTMEVDAWLTGVKSDAFFCPVSISYEKLVEGASYQRELLGGEKQKENAKALLGAASVLRKRYGRITIRMGDPISLRGLFDERHVDPRDHSPDDRRKLVAALGWRISAGINRAAPLAPMGLTCAVLLSHDRRGISLDEVISRAEFLHTAALDMGARAPAWQTGATQQGQLPPSLRESGLVEQALESLHQSGDARPQEAGDEVYWSVPEERRGTLDYHKNGILHFLVAPSILAVALRTFGGAPAPLHELIRRGKDLSRLFKNEFIYEPGKPIEAIVDDAIARLLRWGLAERTGGPGAELVTPLASGGRSLVLLSELLRPFGEGVWLTMDSLNLLLDGPLDPKEWTRRALDRAKGAWLAGRIRRNESRSKALIDNTLSLLRDRGIVQLGEGKGGRLSLAPAWATKEKLAEVLAEVELFLG